MDGVIPSIFAKEVNQLCNHFKNPSLETRIEKLGGRRMILVSDTRWSTHRDVYRRCYENLNFMRQLLTENSDINISEKNYTNLFDPDFETTLRDSILTLDPVCELTNICQRAECSLDEATELWLKLELPVENGRYEQLLDNRVNKALSIYGLAANFLHPVYQGQRFIMRNDLAILVQGMNDFFNTSLNEEGLQELQLYKNKANYFQQLFARNYKSALVFWEAAKWFYPTLSQLAIKLQNLCASTAQLERLFSEWSYVHSVKRNRLAPDRSAKLVALYYDMRINDHIVMAELMNENEE